MTEVTTINDTTGISMLVDLASQAIRIPPSIFIDLEGTRLGRKGYISIFTILIRQPQSGAHSIFLVDILRLRSLAFNTPGKDGTTLKGILESPAIPKVFFDVRSDSDALYYHYKISLQGIEDVQLMENASRPSGVPRRFLNGLAKCVKDDAPLTMQERRAWEHAKEIGERLFKPAKGGSYAVFDQRPISADINSYCAADVRYLPALRDLYWARLSRGMKPKVDEETKDRVRESQMPWYEPEGLNRSRAPPWGNRPCERRDRDDYDHYEDCDDYDDYDDEPEWYTSMGIGLGW